MSRPKFLILTIAAILALAVFALAGFVAPVREGVRFVTLPVARVLANIGASFGSALRLDEASEVANDRADEAEARVRAITVDYVRLRALEEENRSLRAQAAFIVERELQTVGARVISRSLQHGNAVVTIDRGARDR